MTRILDTIDSPSDLKHHSVEELEQLAEEIRGEICNVVSANGGHLAPSLGVVELTIALHATLNCPEDKIVWDVGHQSYTHKLLTNRREQFKTIRTEGGLSGFPNINESEYDAFGTGHSATAISAALGLAAARDIKGTKERIVAVVGDGAMSGGLSFEGLNNAGANQRDLLVVLNDNKMSISPNVGALSRYLTDVITAKTYNKVKQDVWELTNYIPKVKTPVRSILNRMERSLKNLLVPGLWFESLGFRYFGPVDGHDIGHLLQVLSQLTQINGPLLLHVITTKGKGYCFAEQDATRFHGIGAFEQETGLDKKKSSRASYSKVFGNALLQLAEERNDICAITAAMTDSTGLGPFAKKFPERFFDVGIAEGHAITFAAGLARSGLKPVVALYSSFLQRSYDNVIHDVALQKLPVVICIDRAGLVGEDGPTHHGVFDLSFLRHIPNMVVMAPRDENELRAMLKFAVEYQDGPVAIRYPRGSGTAESIGEDFSDIEYGKGELIRIGADAVLCAVGEMVPVAEKAAELLDERGIDTALANMRFIHPLDTSLIDDLIKNGTPLFTIEDNAVAGGFGSSVVEYVSSTGRSLDVHMIGIPDQFAGFATRSRLLEVYGLDAHSIADKVAGVIHP